MTRALELQDDTYDERVKAAPIERLRALDDELVQIQRNACFASAVGRAHPRSRLQIVTPPQDRDTRNQVLAIPVVPHST